MSQAAIFERIAREIVAIIEDNGGCLPNPGLLPALYMNKYKKELFAGILPRPKLKSFVETYIPSVTILVTPQRQEILQLNHIIASRNSTLSDKSLTLPFRTSESQIRERISNEIVSLIEENGGSLSNASQLRLLYFNTYKKILFADLQPVPTLKDFIIDNIPAVKVISNVGGHISLILMSKASHSTNSSTSHTTSETTQIARDITTLIKECGDHIDISLIPNLYKEKYKKTLFVNLSPKPKLQQFLLQIPELKLTNHGSHRSVSLVPSPTKTSEILLASSSHNSTSFPNDACMADAIANEIVALMKQHGGSLSSVSELPQLYEKTYNKKLFTGMQAPPKLKKFIRRNIPMVEIRSDGSAILKKLSHTVASRDDASLSGPLSQLSIHSMEDQLEDDALSCYSTETENMDDFVSVESTSPEQSHPDNMCIPHRTLQFIDAQIQVAAPDMESGVTSASSEAEETNNYDAYYKKSTSRSQCSVTLLDADSFHNARLQGGLLGRVQDGVADGTDLFLNVSDPFCFICVGVQGEGKSHTMNAVLENCMLVDGGDAVSLDQQMSTLVMHYDTCDGSVCESLGLRDHVQRTVVLVSPTYYHQRKQFYGDLEVYPLLFRWNSLNAEQLRKLMHLSVSDSQLYVSTLLNILRQYQRHMKLPTWDEFMRRIEEEFSSPGQIGPLTQRLQILKSFVFESDDNMDLRSLYKSIGNVSELFSSGALVIADMSDPMMSKSDVSGIFQVLLGMFHAKELPCGKVVALDEAHRYLSGEQDELAGELVNIFRMMRHSGMRVLVSTQSPLTMPKEMIELASVIVMHGFRSKEWLNYIASKSNLPEDAWPIISNLERGHALVSCKKTFIVEDACAVPFMTLKIRKRLTMDYGATKSSTAEQY